MFHELMAAQVLGQGVKKKALCVPFNNETQITHEKTSTSNLKANTAMSLSHSHHN